MASDINAPHCSYVWWSTDKKNIINCTEIFKNIESMDILTLSEISVTESVYIFKDFEESFMQLNSKDAINLTIPVYDNESGFDTYNDTLSGSTFSIWATDTIVRITLYTLIFLFSITGNSLVILTLAKNKRMRTVTNAFLLNLAISDLLLGVFCMPFTLIGSLLRNFIFGEVMCRLIPYLQAVSVSVSVWTLVSISLERFFAICRPLHSRQWQTISHAYRVIAIIWTLSFIIMLPIACLSELLPTRVEGKFKCREVWPSIFWEQVFNLYLDTMLLLLPLILMTVVYAFIVRILSMGLRMSKTPKRDFPLTLVVKTSTNGNVHHCTTSEPTVARGAKNEATDSDLRNPTNSKASQRVRPPTAHLIVRSNYKRSQDSRKRVILMLFVLVIEFFVSWTPLYIVNTWSLFNADQVYRTLGSTGVSIIQLLAYSSSCCNPITYCFMHQKFRQGFWSTLCCKKERCHSFRRSGTFGAMANSMSASKNSMVC